MKEVTLKKALDIKRELDKARERKKELLIHDSLCFGNTSEVISKSFNITITDGNKIKSISVKPGSLRLALQNEIKYIDQIINNYLSDLEEL